MAILKYKSVLYLLMAVKGEFKAVYVASADRWVYIFRGEGFNSVFVQVANGEFIKAPFDPNKAPIQYVQSVGLDQWMD